MSEETKKGSGSFCIPNNAIFNLSMPNVTTEAIGAYLVIAMCTGPDGLGSSAGIQALEKYLKCGKRFAERYVEELVKIGVIQDLRANLGVDNASRSAIRFQLIDFGESIEERVWFDRSLVEYLDPKTDEHNVYKLCQMRPECINILLWMYANMSEGGTTVQHPNPSTSTAGIMRHFHISEENLHTQDSFEIKVAHSGDLDWSGCRFAKNYRQAAFTKAIEELTKKGFVYEVVMVWDQPLRPSLVQVGIPTYLPVGANPLYQLHVRKCQGKPSADEVGLSHFTLKVSQYVRTSIAFEDRKLENTYCVISKPGQDLGVAGVFRLSHRVKNPKNNGVKEAWATLMDSERAYRKWLNHTIQDVFGSEIDFQNLSQSAQFEAKTQAVMKRQALPQSVSLRGG